MRTTFETHGAGGWSEPENRPRVRRLARVSTTVAILIAAFCWGTLVAAASDVLTDMQTRGEMDPTS
jgi:hypothetical protein